MLVLAGFAAVTLVPEPGVVLMLIGAFPWLARAMPANLVLDVRRPRHGILLRVRGHRRATPVPGPRGRCSMRFFLNSSLDRYQVVASKAFTQTLGHLAKIGYYGLLIGPVAETDIEGPVWLIGAACLVARAWRPHRHAAARAAR